MNPKRSELREIEYSPAGAVGPGRKAWFHQWSSEPFDSEHSGYISKTYGIIEEETGHVKLADPRHIRFVDNQK